MKDTAPIGLGIIAVAALFGIVAAGVAFVAFDFALAGAVFIGGIVAVIAAIVLLLGWREPNPLPGETSVTQAAAPQSTAPAPAETNTAAPVAAAPAAAAAPSASTAATVADAPKVKPSTPLAGQEELAAKKGDWRYEAADTGAKPAAPAAAAAAAPEPAPAAAVPAGEAAKPEFLSQARDGGPDDLKQIKGVGPKLEKTLHGMGIFHFDQISVWGPAEQAWIDDNLEGFKGRATRDNWVEQAKVLAAGGQTEFSKKVEKGSVY